MKTKDITTPNLRKSIGRSPLRLGLPRVQRIWIIRGFFLIPLVLVCFALPSTVQATSDCTHYLVQDGCNALHLNDGMRAMFYDTAIGAYALYSNSGGGNQNSAFGAYSLYSNTTGTYNTAVGYRSLNNNTDGDYNTATGSFALTLNNHGGANTATGYQALDYNRGGAFNTATGYQALFDHQDGVFNTATGSKALHSTIDGSYNTADGAGALYHNTGGDNVALGFNAGYNLTTGFGNVCIGYAVEGVAGESNTTRIRNVYHSVASARAVYVNSDNKIGTLLSTRRVKENIKPMDKASEAILALKPVSFRYKKEIDASGSPQFGLIAEDVAGINADLVTRDAEGKPETVRYESINAMLLNEFLKEHRKVEQLEANGARQQKQIEALTAGLQRVSAQLEASRPALQVSQQ